VTDSLIQTLLNAAVAASYNAYAPYSKYPVGAALQAADGTIFTGCNIENAAYPSGLCAERVAVGKAVSEGRRTFTMLVVVTRDGGFPCGMCRQVLYEFAPELRMVMADLQQKILFDGRLSDLLPHSFGPSHLISEDERLKR
jgi:cytidine deaminase